MPRYSMGPTTPHNRSRNTTTPKSKSKQKQLNFSFPILEPKELFDCLKELGTSSLTDEELHHCEKNVPAVRRLFENLLENLTGIRKEEMNQPVFAAHEKLSYCQLHEDSIPELAFWRQISSLMDVCGISDFTREDITRPEPKRLRRQLSALINFAKFREDQFQMYDAITVDRDSQLDRLSTIDGENDALQKKLDDLREKNKAQRQEVKELTEQTHEMASKVSQANEEQGELRTQSAQYKQENCDLKDKLKAMQAEYESLIAEQKKLQGQVVQSPERVRREMLESQRALECERREGEAAEQAALVATTAAKAVSEAVVKVNDIANSADELLQMSSKCIDYGKQIKKQELAISNNERQRDEIKQRVNDVERRCARLSEKSKHLEVSCESKAEQAVRMNDELRSKLLEQKRKKATEVATFGEDDKMCELIESTMDQENIDHRRKMSELMSAWRKLEKTALSQQHHVANEVLANRQIPQHSAPFGGYNAYAATPYSVSTPYRAN